LFGPPPGPELLPGSRIDLAVDWGVFRFVVWVAALEWLALASYALIPGMSVVFGKASLRAGARAQLFLVATAVAALLIGGIIYRYRRAVGVIFTSEGMWTPAWTGGRFQPWAELLNASLKDGKNIDLLYPDGTYRLYAVGFKDPFAVSRLVRQGTADRVGGSLPVTGER
jgi:hypothetical protein